MELIFAKVIPMATVILLGFIAWGMRAGVKAFREYAKTTPNKIDDAIAAALGKPVERAADELD